jgi:putative glutamine amidotransferase
MLRVALTTSQDTPVTSYVTALEPHFIVERILPGDSRNATEFDGLVLAGGPDVNPALYGAEPNPQTESPDDERDLTEMRLIEEAIAADVPILAICRGMQMLNVALGGALIQHLPNCTVHKQKGITDAHAVGVHPASRLAKIVGTARVAVNSRHHQAVIASRLGRDLQIAAYRPEDQVIEALEMPDRQFVVAVQWHPEDRVNTHKIDRQLFAAFADAVNRSAAALQGDPATAAAEN